ncbi:MAG: bifunctional [glutamate--ammonia ligase]-adenylyl-L-tyrosine phosphorylase/[glutamate--ammonia-ligase] adenylyltransferase [Thermodesulfobacteriota bacterium]
MKTNLPEEIERETEDKWQRLLESAGTGTAGKSIPGELRQILAFSNFVANHLIHKPELLQDLLNGGDLERSYGDGEYQQRAIALAEQTDDETRLGNALRRFRCREMIRIAFRDLTGRAELSETMRDLSALADACIDAAMSRLYRWLEEKYGTPADENGDHQPMIVIGLGKLGAKELNFSSDVDLLLAYPRSGQTRNGPRIMDNEEFFLHLSRRFLALFSATSEEGLLFRVDLRLRPFGENGPLIMSFNALEDYYQAQGREWERYALIKARVVSGDKTAGKEILTRLEPFIYRRYFDYGTFESLRLMKESIALEVNRKGMQDNIKLGPGGIREIEFFGQVFQLIRGGVEPELKEPAILKVLQLLVDKRYIEQATCDELTAAYRFQRNTEHRLQMRDDLQTHLLPQQMKEKSRLALASGFAAWEEFAHHLSVHMGNVNRHFNGLLAVEDHGAAADDRLKTLEGLWLNLLDAQKARQELKEIGYDSPDDILKVIDYLRNDPETRALSPEGRKRLNRLIPMILKRAAESGNPGIVFKRLMELVKAIERRTCYIALLLESPETIDQLVKLGQASPWIVSFLARHPVLLDELLDARNLYKPPSRPELEQELHLRMARIPDRDLEFQLESLCIFKQINILRVAATDISAVYPLMRVSDHLSDIAEIVINRIFDLAWEHLAAKHGIPRAEIGGNPCRTGFAVVAYGKLGGLELGYGSDLDIVFLHAASPGQTSGGPAPTENVQFYSRIGQRIIHLLTAPTRAGVLYEIDTRLRPSGNSGPLVSQVEAFREYQLNQAWTWEHQALVRARVICGDADLAGRFQEIRREIICRPRNRKELAEEIRNMRGRMRENLPLPPAGMFDLKQGPGGIVDIEFLVQYLVLLHAHQHPELVRWTDNVRQLETLSETGIIDPATALFLKQAYLHFRGAVHRLNLQETPAVAPEEAFRDNSLRVGGLWREYIE